jgi:chromosome segregation and condensation protein ScpB
VYQRYVFKASRGGCAQWTVSAAQASASVVDTLLARGLIADDARFGGRGRRISGHHRRFQQVMGIGSLAELPAMAHDDRA